MAGERKERREKVIHLSPWFCARPEAGKPRSIQCWVKFNYDRLLLTSSNEAGNDEGKEGERQRVTHHVASFCSRP